MPTELKSRRPHSRGSVRCNACGRVIRRGEEYRRDTLVYDGHVYDWPECAHCEAFDKLVDFWELCGTPDEGYIGENVRDAIAGSQLVTEDRATAVAANRYLRQWANRRTGELYDVPKVAS